MRLGTFRGSPVLVGFSWVHFGSCWLLFGHLHVCDGVAVLSATEGWILPFVVGWVFWGLFLLVCHCLGHLHLCLGVVCDLSRSSARLGTHQFCMHKVCRVYGVDDVAVCDIPSTHNILGYGLFMIHFFWLAVSRGVGSMLTLLRRWAWFSFSWVLA